MKTLVIVDVQRDFFCPEGSLYVAGGEALPARIAEAAADADRIIFTLDWHPADHCSFSAQGGPWPAHCVQYTQGAGLADEFTSLLKRGSAEVALYFKGQDRELEEYGAFARIPEDSPILGWLRESDSVEVCGIAGDYCVKESTAALLDIPGVREKITVRTDLTVSIDGGAALDAFIKENKLGKK